MSQLTADRVATWADEHLRPFGLVGLVVGGSVAYLIALAWAWQHTTYNVWGAIMIAPLLFLIAYPMARYAAYTEGDATMVRLVIGALVLKLGMTLVRYVVAFGVYGGSADSKNYHDVGATLFRQFRSGDLDTNGAALSGTGFIRVLTGAIYAVTGPTIIGGFLVFSFLGFWGLYFFYRAYRIAVPDGDHRRYARLVFFLPSLLFWPSSIGKEAWMCLWLGVAALGAAKAIARHRGGLPITAVGIAACAIVRPHVALLFFIGFGAAYLLRPSHHHSWLGPIPKVVGILVLLGSSVVLLGEVERYFGVGQLDDGGATTVLGIAEERSSGGGSQFDAIEPTTPAGFVLATVTVLFRPFPNEAGNIQAMLAAVEALLLLLLVALAIPRLVPLLWNLRRWSYGTLSLTYTLFFCYAFASISNFGILTRQRVQVLPFLLVLICLPARRPATVITREAELHRAHG